MHADPAIRWQAMRGRTAAGATDARAGEAVEVVRERRRPEGWWLLDARHRDTLYADVAGAVGAASRWVTLRALRVLAWWERG